VLRGGLESYGKTLYPEEATRQDCSLGTLNRGCGDATALRVDYSGRCEKKGPIDRSVVGIDLKLQVAGDIASNHLMPSHDLQSGWCILLTFVTPVSIPRDPA
jgi:hypothetical protein